jgi:hypothetical protein
MALFEFASIQALTVAMLPAVSVAGIIRDTWKAPQEFARTVPRVVFWSQMPSTTRSLLLKPEPFKRTVRPGVTWVAAKPE